MAEKIVPSPAALRGKRKTQPTVRPVDYSAVPELARRRAKGEEITVDDLAQCSGNGRLQNGSSATAASNRTPQRVQGAAQDSFFDVGPGESGSARQAKRSGVNRGLHRGERFELVPPPAPGPEDAMVTINPSDPRPYTRPLRVIESEVRTVSGASLARITHRTIVLTVADPEDAWTSDNGVSDHYVRGAWTVQVRRGDNHVIGAFPSGYALAVRPSDAQVIDPSDFLGPSNRRKKGTRHPGDQSALKKRLEEHGFTVTSSGTTHGKVTHPDFPGLFTPWASTPSDRRHPQMVVAQVKRVFGIDIRS